MSEKIYTRIHIGFLSLHFALILAGLISYLVVGELWLSLSILSVSLVGIAFSLVAFFANLPILYLGLAAGYIVMDTGFLNFSTVGYNHLFLIDAIFAIAGGLALTVLSIVFKKKIKRPGWISVMCLIAVVAISILGFGVPSAMERNAGSVGFARFQVPSFVDSIEANDADKGKVEDVYYDTKHYATDQSAIQKRAQVYLPPHYDPSVNYNILYLLHGTGDDEVYWLSTNHQNKVMLDNLINMKTIKPLIVVTPTWYVGNDCADDLDQLTWSFKNELRNDLMPTIEKKYSTYTNGATDSNDFASTRDHRAFAGLSRGAVTTYHSVFMESLDYFSYIGTFSGSRTNAEQLMAAIDKNNFKNLSIHYYYAAAGTFDFAEPLLYRQYNDILKLGLKIEGTRFDAVPFRYHSMGNWHVNLYNYLQVIFK